MTAKDKEAQIKYWTAIIQEVETCRVPETREMRELMEIMYVAFQNAEQGDRDNITHYVSPGSKHGLIHSAYHLVKERTNFIYQLNKNA